MMDAEPRPPPLPPVRLLAAAALAIVLLAFAGARFAPSPSWAVFFDNAHWTVSTIAAAAFAWLGWRQGSGIEREARRWFFLALAAYAFGQLLWDIQVYTGWNPFPAPADLFYLMLGPGCVLGLLVCLRGRLSQAGQQSLVLDVVMFTLPVLLFTLLLYLPRAENSTLLQLAAYTAYPVSMLTAASVCALVALYLKPRFEWPWMTFVLALVANGVLWMLWNAQLMQVGEIYGTLLNLMFSLTDLTLGWAALHWRLRPATDARQFRRFERLQRLLPLLSIAIIAAAVTLVLMTGGVSPAMRYAVLAVVMLVLVLAFLRQSVLLVESDQLLRAEAAVRKSEARLKRLNQLYAAVLSSNAAMMRFKDEKTLMEAICRIAVELGGMNLAWIGQWDAEARRIAPLARYGAGTDYLDQIDITVNPDEPQGQGPTGTALREGRAVVNDSYRTNPAMAPWRDSALKCGWGSSAAFPVSRGGRSSAVLSVYHAEEYAFDSDVTELLQDMADSLSFALDKLDEAQAREAATRKLELAARVFAEAHEGILITDPNGVIVDVNPAFCEITGYSREEMLGQNPRILASGRHAPEFYREMWQALAERGQWRGEIWNRRKNGELYAQLLTISALRNETGGVRNYIGMCSDITHLKRQQESLELMAHYDPLTRLPNRVLLADRLGQALARSRRENTLLAVCYLDLDGFKQVNDTLGHEAGDRLLMEVAERIRSSLREGDTLSRLGGDEFALLLNDIRSLQQCEQALGRVHAAVGQPYRIDGQLVGVGVSTGFTLYPLDDADADTLLRHADQAMYRAKSEGRNRYHLFDAGHDQEVQIRRQQLQAIEQAFARGEFCLYYQPKVDMTTGRVTGAEALIRWRHPERGLVPPAEFLPVIEGTPFEIVAGNWVVDEALRQMTAWRAAGLDLPVSINISPLHLQWAHFFDQLEATLALYPDLPSGQLQLEVLESGVLGDLDAVSGVLRACHDTLGVDIALDDFGTGYSSLTHLRHLPADTVKIDQSFVRNMIDDPDDYAIVDGVVGLSEAFYRKPIAEGVETRDHGLMLLIMGCTHAQGYGVARPMPPEAVPGWVQGYQPDAKWRDYVRNPPSPREAQLLLLQIESSQWLRRMEASLDTPPGGRVHWPIMNDQHCHTGRWLRRARKDAQFDPVLVTRLAAAHAELHQLGNRLRALYLDGKIEEARAGIAELRALHAQIEGLISLLA